MPPIPPLSQTLVHLCSPFCSVVFPAFPKLHWTVLPDQLPHSAEHFHLQKCSRLKRASSFVIPQRSSLSLFGLSHWRCSLPGFPGPCAAWTGRRWPHLSESKVRAVGCAWRQNESSLPASLLAALLELAKKEMYPLPVHCSTLCHLMFVCRALQGRSKHYSLLSAVGADMRRWSLYSTSWIWFSSQVRTPLFWGTGLRNSIQSV